MSGLIRYDAARHALKVAHDVDEVKGIRDKAQAAAAYARQAQDDNLIKWATDIKLRAERKCGEMLSESEKNKGVIDEQRGAAPAPRLADLKISKHQSADFQAIATIPEAEFEAALAEPKVSTASLVKKAKKKAEPKERKPKPAKAPKVESVTKEKHSELADKYNELVDRNKELATEMENLTAIQDGDAAKQMKKLQALLDQANRSRDEAMNKAAALQKQNKFLEGELKKLGWKRDKP